MDLAQAAGQGRAGKGLGSAQAFQLEIEIMIGTMLAA
jgi:hypothetical protein